MLADHDTETLPAIGLHGDPMYPGRALGAYEATNFRSTELLVHMVDRYIRHMY